MAKAANLGFPRIGPERELKRATEGYWSGDVSREELETTAADLRARNWRVQSAAGIDRIPSNDFSLYDHVLDTAALLGVVPERYRTGGDGVGLESYFAMARGAQTEGLDVQALEMTKWFDTNYHYIVPELAPDQEFRISSSKPVDEFRQAEEMGIRTRPVLLGPVSFLLLSKTRGGDFDPLSRLLVPVTEAYCEVLRRLGEAGADWVQMDEPCLVSDMMPGNEVAALEGAYGRIAQDSGDVRLMVQTYFGDMGEAYSTLTGLGVDGVGMDFVRGRRNLELLREQGFPDDKVLSAGVVDGRNVWINDFDASLRLLEELADRVGSDRLEVAPSCSLLHVPLDASRETGLDAELRSWLSFARQKLAEVSILTRALNEGRDAVERELEANREARDSRTGSSRTRNPRVRRRIEEADPSAARAVPFAERRARQQERLELPGLPTTTIGSFPQHSEVRAKRRAYRSGELDREEYEQFIEEEIARCIEVQEEADLDVLVHGEFERNDMVEYFAERMEGFAFTEKGWVQSYGSRYVKPPILYGDVDRPEPITVRWWEHADRCTDRPVKAMLTGPVTMLQWSFVRDDQPRRETCRQLALAIRREVTDLEEAGAPVVQVDEPALREGLPLRRAEWDDYLEWAVDAFRMSIAGTRPETQVHTHMCYSEFNDIIEHIARMDADVLLIENARSDEELLEVFRDFDYGQDIGPGVYDIHSPRVPPSEEMAERIRASLSVLPAERIWVNPDCGLKTRNYEEVEPSLRNMVEAARSVREELGEEAAAPA
jgi:5-methyltetrahydropteroyltriglutamate--homocysteine methyltransferase